tara:strand:+ start:214 stop:750 length:537 start_codon:yes stop_codon:yes gene_type:complete
MTGWLYLIRNKDLYKIGITKNFENRMRQLKPDNVVIKIYTSEFIKLEKELHHRYKKFRIPQTEYFRLEKIHLNEIKKRIYYIDYPTITTYRVFIKSFLCLLFVFCFIYIFISLTINDLNIVLLKSILLTERISVCLSIISIFFHSGKNFSFLNELKYRVTRTIFFIIFACFLRICSAF